MTLEELNEAIDTFRFPDMRDRFAMQALPALIRNADPDMDAKAIARTAYVLADAMVEQMGDGRAAAEQR